MRLFSAPDGAVDRYDRATWLTQPFDLAWQAPAVARGGQAVALGYWGAALSQGPGGGVQGHAAASAATAGMTGRSSTGAAVTGTPGRESAAAAEIGAIQ